MNHMLSRDQLIEMVETYYFAAVDRKDMAATLACFQPEAAFTIQTHFTTHEGRDVGIRRMFEHLFGEYRKIWHGNFHHIVDLEHGAIASQFDVELVTSDGRRLTHSNCNFFYLDKDRFRRVFVYFSGENALV